MCILTLLFLPSNLTSPINFGPRKFISKSGVWSKFACEPFISISPSPPHTFIFIVVFSPSFASIVVCPLKIVLSIFSVSTSFGFVKLEREIFVSPKKPAQSVFIVSFPPPSLISAPFLISDLWISITSLSRPV